MASRNPKWIATIGLVGCTLLLALALRAGDMSLLRPQKTTYAAEFTDAGGLRVGDPVEVAGVAVGTVEEVDVEADHVLVEFEVDSDIALGDRTTAGVKVGSLLGKKYLDVTPKGAGRLESGTTIPRDRTTPAYDVVAAFEDLTDIAAKVDTEQLATSLDVLADTFRNSGPEVRTALRGLSQFSKVIASRDEQLTELLDHADTTANVLDNRRGDVVELVKASNLLLGELQRRKSAVHSLLVHTTALATQLRGLVDDNQKTLTPALRRLDSVTRLLAAHQRDLRMTIRNSRNYISTFNNVVGSGPWFDVVIPRLPNSVRVED